MDVVRVIIIGGGAVLVILGIYAIFTPHMIIDVLGYELVYGIENPTYSSDGKLIIYDVAQSMHGSLVIDCVKYGLVVVGCVVAFIGIRLAEHKIEE